MALSMTTTSFNYQLPKEIVWRVPGREIFQAERRVLVADDDISSSNAIVLALQDAGFFARAAYTGIDTVHAAKAFAPGVVLVDLLMPLGDGWEVADALRAKPDPPMLIAHTSVSTYPELVRCQQAGFDAYFAKPCDLDRLIELLNACFSQ
jgi:CheY-like chemotaxis protein